MARILRITCILWTVLLATPGQGAEISRAADTERAGYLSTYGLYNFDYSRMPRGAYNTTCKALVEPGLMYTVSDRLAVGAAVQSQYDAHTTSLAEQTRYSLGLSPKIRYQMQLSDTLSIIPELTVSYLSGWQSDTMDHLPANSQLWATLYLPLLIRPTRLSQGDFRPMLQWDVKSTVHLNNGSGALGVFAPGSRNEADVSCQSTLGLHF